MKILFLDFDGVLNSHRTVAAFGNYPHNLDADLELFDWVAIRMLQRLCTDPSLRIVLSTAWRSHTNPLDAASAFGLPIISKTPHLPSGVRGEEIQHWLDHCTYDFEAYAIIDDDSDMLESQQPFFVHTSHQEGMLYTHFNQLISILSLQVSAAPSRDRHWNKPTSKLDLTGL